MGARKSFSSILLFAVVLIQLATVGLAYGRELSVSSYSQEGMQRVYDRGAEAFKRKDYKEALFWFDIFLDAFPESGMAGDALYWKGEASFNLKDYAAAAAAFAAVLERYPRGDKAQAAMLKLGLAYLEMGDGAEGAKYLKRVISAYPNTEAAKLAEKRLKDASK